ncbi:MAG TPA: hypothetical protein VIE91_03085 [Methylophilaceae bacterium]|jgi:hypothetical protein
MRTLFLALFLALSGTAIAEANQLPTADINQLSEIPTAEKEFVATINGFEKTKIVEQFGEPSKKDDIKTDSGKIVASVWQYHYLNTTPEGEYYQTTELDFVDDKVVMVVFMNGDGTDNNPVDGLREIPPLKPDL